MDHIYNLKWSLLDGSETKYENEQYAGLMLPEQIDLREFCPPVYDQGKQGSCTANAGCAARSMLDEDPSLYLSRAFQYYMERSLVGATEVDAGASMKDIISSMQTFGVCLDADMPYNPDDYKTPPSKKAKQNAMEYKITDGKLLHGLFGIRSALASRVQPVLLGMKVYASMESPQVARTGVLPMPGRNEEYFGNHAVLAVGYLSGLPQHLQQLAPKYRGRTKQAHGYLVVRNSWGESWGDKGYFYMPYAYVEKGHAFEAWIMEK